MSGPRIDPKTGMIVYRPGGDVLRRFMVDDNRVTIIQGPWGSGKSAGCCLKIWKYMIGQAPQRDGMRRTRWCVVRNTYAELQETTIKTWLDWFPEDMYGTFIRSKPFRHEIRVGDVEADVIFLALDDEEDRKKLLSLEMTGFWFNELREIAKGIIDDATGRLRYPAVKDGGATWRGVIGDTNAPSEDHWLPIMRGDVPAPEHFDEEKRKELEKPDSWSLYVQPPGMNEICDEKGFVVEYQINPLAENVENLPEGYYPDLIKGKSKSWIDVNVLNRLGRIQSGKAVFPMYKPALHLAKKPIAFNPNLPLLCGVDFGRQPAALFGQCLRGEWAIIHEFMGADMGATTFAPLLKREILQKFPAARPEQVQFWGDPAGDDMTQSDEKTPYQIFRTHGLFVRPAPGNNRLNVRLEAVEMVLTKLIDGKPAFLVSPTCTVFKAAMDGGYKYRRLHTSAERYAPEPEKDQYSHIADAGQYLLLGGGEGRALVLGNQQRAKTVDTVRRVSVFGRGAR
jgi:hypothetical protein